FFCRSSRIEQIPLASRQTFHRRHRSYYESCVAECLPSRRTPPEPLPCRRTPHASPLLGSVGFFSSLLAILSCTRWRETINRRGKCLLARRPASRLTFSVSFAPVAAFQ